MGGISTAVLGMARASARAGMNVAVISFDAWRPTSRATPTGSPTCEPTEFGAPILRVTSTDHLPTAHTFADRFRPDVLHVHNGMLWDFAAAARHRLTIPVVKSVHVLHRTQNAIRGVCEQTMSLVGQEKALAEADLVLVPSLAARAELISGDATLARRLHVVGHGIDASPLLVPGHRAPGSVLSVGRFADVKGTGDLFSLIPRVVERLPDASFVIAGGVPGNRKAEQRWWKRWREQVTPTASARARCVGWLPRGDLTDLYRRAAVLVVPSLFETFGLVALEGMESGIAVATTNGGALSELVSHGENGLVCKPGDVAGMTENVVRLLQDQALARRLGQRAAADVRRNRQWDSVVPALQRTYSELRRTGVR